MRLDVHKINLDKSLVIYDGECGFCKKCSYLIQKLDWFRQFECRPLQDESLYQKCPFLTQESCIEELKLVYKKNKNLACVYGGAKAVIKIALRLPLLMPVALFFSLPLNVLQELADFLYKKVSQNRTRKASSCSSQKNHK